MLAVNHHDRLVAAVGLVLGEFGEALQYILDLNALLVYDDKGVTNARALLAEIESAGR